MPARWLISRTDRLGDLLLTIPVGNFIRHHLSEVEPVFLVSAYAAPLLDHHVPPFPYVVWEDLRSLRGYEAIIHAFPRWLIAWRAWRSGISRRVGTGARWYHWLTCTDLPFIRRRRSGKHEAYLNLQLLCPLLSPSLCEVLRSMSWEDLLSYRPRLAPKATLKPNIQKRIEVFSLRLVLHVGTGGGAPLWQYWQELAKLLLMRYPQALLIFTGSKPEKPLIDAFEKILPSTSWLNVAGDLSLAELITVLGQAQVVIAGSTGPLHIAAAVGVPVVGIYPATIAMGPWRWKPLTPASRILSTGKVCPRCSPAYCECLAAISPREVLQAVEELIAEKVSYR